MQFSIFNMHQKIKENLLKVFSKHNQKSDMRILYGQRMYKCYLVIAKQNNDRHDYKEDNDHTAYTKKYLTCIYFKETASYL